MKILHIAVSGEYTEGWSYQDNLLPKYHRRMGYEVTVIVGPLEFDSNGVSFINNQNNEYNLEDGRKIKRLTYSGLLPSIARNKLKPIKNLYKSIEEEAPDIIFLHGIQSVSISKILKYIKENPNVKLFVDSHVDFSNSATNWFSKNILHKIIWRHFAKMLQQRTDKFFGVLPARVDFLVDVYNIPKNRVDLLVMGADDDQVLEASNPNVKEKVREQYGINKDDFLIMTGGKIDSWKWQTILLMQAVKKLNYQNVKLIVFGSVSEELRDKVNELSDGNIINYIGWINSEKAYKMFASADLVVFPGRHSIFWEQVVGQKIPLLCKYWNGTTHIDIGGNVKFLYDDSLDEIYDQLNNLLENRNTYNKLKLNAEKRGSNIFLYSEIAKKSIL